MKLFGRLFNNGPAEAEANTVNNDINIGNNQSNSNSNSNSNRNAVGSERRHRRPKRKFMIVNILEHERFTESTGWQHGNLNKEMGDPRPYRHYYSDRLIGKKEKEKRQEVEEKRGEGEEEREEGDSVSFPDPSPRPDYCFDGEW